MLSFADGPSSAIGPLEGVVRKRFDGVHIPTDHVFRDIWVTSLFDTFDKTSSDLFFVDYDRIVTSLDASFCPSLIRSEIMRPTTNLMKLTSDDDRDALITLRP